MSHRSRSASRWVRAMISQIARAIQDARRVAGLPCYQPKPSEMVDAEGEQREQ